MEWPIVLLSSLFAAIAPAGLIVDRVAEKAVRSQLASVGQLAVRIDNTPSYRGLQGKIDRIRIAGREVEPLPHLRLAVLDLETDEVDVDFGRLRQGGGLTNFKAALRQPFQGAVRLVVREADINRALQSPSLQARLQESVSTVLPQQEGSPLLAIDRLDVQLDFLGDGRARVEIRLQPQPQESQPEAAQAIELVLEGGFSVTAGRTLQIHDPKGTLNGRRLSSKLLQGLAAGLSQDYLDLRSLEGQGVTARILRLQVDAEELDLALFVRVEPESRQKRFNGSPLAPLR